MALYILLAVFFVVLDRFLKFLAVNSYNSDQFRIFGDFFQFNFIPNYNIAFSLPITGVFLNFVIISIIVILLYELLFSEIKNEWPKATLLTFIIFGAISNMLDRLKYGFVIDYLDLKYFTVFNIADVMIVGGVLGMFFITIKSNKL